MHKRWRWLGLILVAILIFALIVSERLKAVSVVSSSSPLDFVNTQRINPVHESAPAIETPHNKVVEVAPKPIADPHSLVTDKEEWARIPLDRDGTSLGLDAQSHNKMTPFNRAFSAVVTKEVKNCLKDAPHEEPPSDGGFSSLTVTMALSIEGTGSGYDILDAEMVDGAIDAYRKRCLELAMTTQIETPGAGGEPGKRYRLEFPILVGYEKH